MKAAAVTQNESAERLSRAQTAPDELKNRTGASVPTGEAARLSPDESEQRVAGRTTELSAKNAELETRESLVSAQRLLQTLLDHVPDLIYFKDTQSRFLHLNQALARYLGAAEPETVIGKTDFDFNVPERAKEFFEDEQRIMKTGEALVNKVEKQVLPNGEVAWTSTTKVPLRDEKGKIVGLAGISRDVTAQIKAEESLRLSRDELEKQVAERAAELSKERLLLRTLIDNLPDIIFAKDSQSRFILTNMACVQQLGSDAPEKVLGKSDADFVKPELAAQYRADEQALMQSGQPMHREERTQHKTLGEMHWSLTTKLPLKDAGGRVVGLMGIARDITRLKKAEEALAQERILLRAIIDNLPDSIYAKDTTGRKTLANPADLKNLRCKTEAEAIGKNDFDFFPKDIAEKFWTDDLKVIGGEPVINREEYFFDEASQKRWLLTSKLPLRDREGKILGLVGIGRDITAIKEADAKLEQAHKQLLETSRQAGMAEVATSILHNVGNVLNSVNVASACAADTLRKSKAANLPKVATLLREHETNLGDFITNDPKGKQLPGYLVQLAEHLAAEHATALDHLVRLQKNIEYIRGIIAMQQNYARTTDVLESLPVADLVEDAMRINAGSIERHSIKLLREYSEMPPILVNKHKVLQILVNLINNAKHACNESEKPDRQIILRVVNENERVKISVADNGVGIPAENMTRIFNHGFTTRKDGHGFGLHSGALAAKEMGGSLVAFSGGPGQGATFTLELPRQRQKANP